MTVKEVRCEMKGRIIKPNDGFDSSRCKINPPAGTFNKTPIHIDELRKRGKRPIPKKDIKD